MITSELYMERTPYEDFEMLNEAIWDSFTKGMKKSFAKSSSYGEKNYGQFGSFINKAIANGQGMANYMSQKTGVSPALALALTVAGLTGIASAGLTGGASAIPMGAVMYFTRKHMNKLLGSQVGKLVDKGFDAFGKSPEKKDVEKQQTSPNKSVKKRPYDPSSFEGKWPKNMMPYIRQQASPPIEPRTITPNVQPQSSYFGNFGNIDNHTTFSAPRFENFLSFKEWLVNEEGWADSIAKKAGQYIGAGAGYVYGFGKSLLKSVGDRIRDVISYISTNPRQATKMAAIVGVAMLTGGIVGKISHSVVDAVTSKISQIMPHVDPQDLQSTMAQVSPVQDAVAAKSQVAQDAVAAKSQAAQDAVDAKSQAVQHPANKFIPDSDVDKQRLADEIKNAADRPTGYDRFGRSLADLHDKAETKNLFRAMKDAFGGNSHELKMGSLPHGMTVDMNGDGIPDNPTFNYYNKTDHTFYGSDGKPEWKFDGKNIMPVDKNSFVPPAAHVPTAPEPAHSPTAPEPAPAQSYLQTKMQLARDRIAQMKQDAAEAERLGAASGNLPSVRTLPDGSVMKSFSGRLPPGYSR
jgi:hypothetical protein